MQYVVPSCKYRQILLIALKDMKDLRPKVIQICFCQAFCVVGSHVVMVTPRNSKPSSASSQVERTVQEIHSH